MAIQYEIVRDGDRASVIAVNPQAVDAIKQADSSHPHWLEICRLLKEDNPDAFELFDVGAGVVRRLQAVSSRVSFDGTDIYFDGDKQDSAIAKHLIEVIRSGADDYMPLVKFWEKLAANPSANSRNQLFKWLQSDAFSITEDGNILGYKGMFKRADGVFEATNMGHGFVNGVEMRNSPLPAKIGDTVSMVRSEVVDNPNNHCASGLHIGTFSYARSFGDTRVLVEFNPRDAVSVPESEKIRVCKYKLLGPVDEKSQSPIGFKVKAYSPQVGDRL